MITGQPLEPAPRELDAADIAERLKTRRNDPCPCGSETKYKKCCLAKDQAWMRDAAQARMLETTMRVKSTCEQQLQQDQTIVERTADEDAAIFAEETAPRSAVEAKLDALWCEFAAFEHPSSQQMDVFLNDLLALPPEETDWCDLFHEFARRGHRDLPAVFRRITSAIPPTRESGISFFFWAAAEEFDRHDYRHLFAEVAAAYRTLDGQSYDADALLHLEEYLLAVGDDAEALRLCEHFLPILREDGGLMPYAVPAFCGRIFELRIGAALRNAADAHPPAADVARTLRTGLEEEVDGEAAANAAAAITSEDAPWAREQFDLAFVDIRSDSTWHAALRLRGALIGVAREAWQLEQVAPGCAVVGLQLLLTAVYESLEKRRKRKKTGSNILSYLTPEGIEKRVVATCRGLIGVNIPKARLLLDAHDILARFAWRHRLISPAEAEQTQTELARLRSLLE